MLFRKLLYMASLLIVLTSCSTPIEKNEVDSHTSSLNKVSESLKNVDIKISSGKTLLNYGDKIVLDITLTNNDKEAQKLLFDKPVSTAGPWGVSAIVTDKKTNKSVLKYGNKELLSSQIYTEDQLKEGYYTLQPEQSISKKYELHDIVVFNNEDNLLPRGTYDIQINYYRYGKQSDFISSNIIKLSIK